MNIHPTSLFQSFLHKKNELIIALLLIALFFLPIGKGLSETCFVLSIILFLIPFRKELFSPLSLPEKAMVVFLIWIAVTLPFAARANNWGIGFRGILKWAEVFMIYWVVKNSFTTNLSKAMFIKIFILSCLLIAFSGFFQFFSGHDFLRSQTLDPGRIMRIKSSLGASNSLSCFFYFGIFAAVYLIQNIEQTGARRKFWLILSFISIAVFTCGFILTYSRGGFLALLVSFSVFLLKYLKFLKTKKTFILLGIIVSLFFLSTPLRTNFFESLQRKDITINLRTEYWGIAGKMISQNPLIGIGANLFHKKFNEYRTQEVVPAGYAHNSYLQIASETGIPGLLIFLAIFILTAIQKPTQNAIILQVPLLAFLLHAFVDNVFFAFQTSFLFWLFFGLYQNKTS